MKHHPLDTITKGPQIGVMQGRLLPKYKGRYQAHPVGCWQQEFPLAAELELSWIEFILDFHDVWENPLMSKTGIDEIHSLSEKTGVVVKTVCADYFMEAPLHSLSTVIVQQSQKVLLTLIEHCSQIKVTEIVIPCVDQSSLIDDACKQQFIQNLQPGIKLAEKLAVNLALETDLAPGDFVELLDQFDSLRITVNYDTGNSAALGYDPSEELAAYGSKITDIHIKDRFLNGGSTLLGTGDTDFDRFFEALKKINYQGPFIMQAYRDDEGVAVFKSQLDWISPRIKSKIPHE